MPILKEAKMRVLVIDIGGSHVKTPLVGSDARARVESADDMGPEQILRQLQPLLADWQFDVVSIGYPGEVGKNGPGKIQATWAAAGLTSIFRRRSENRCVS
jgi:predicted NBD/HSP70 family sugar kinase